MSKVMKEMIRQRKLSMQASQPNDGVKICRERVS